MNSEAKLDLLTNFVGNRIYILSAFSSGEEQVSS